VPAWLSPREHSSLLGFCILSVSSGSFRVMCHILVSGLLTYDSKVSELSKLMA
jgi:hypothetical protein